MFYPGKQPHLMKMSPKIGYILGLVKDKAYEKQFYHMMASSVKNVKKSEANLNEVVKQIEKIHKHEPEVKGIAYFFMSVLIKLSSFTDYTTTIL